MSDSEYIEFQELRRQISASTRTLHEMVKDHKIPTPHSRDENGSMRWLRSTIKAWKNKTLPAETETSEGRPMSIFEVAAAIGRTLAETRAMISDGSFAPGFLHRSGRRWHFSDVQRWLDQQQERPALE